MSTILKALKRSEASRPRDSSLPLGPMTGGVATGRRGAAPWLAAAALILAGSAAWWWAEHRSATGPGGSADAQRRIAEVSLPARPADPADAESESRPQEFASSVAGTQTPNTDEPDSGNDPAERDPAGSSSRADAQDGEADSTEPADADEASGVAELADAAADPDTGRPDAAPEQNLDRFALLPRFRDLPAARRDSLPKLVLNAHVHAAEPGQRFVLINLSRYGEGDRVAGGLTVAAIFPGGVVLEDDHGRFVLPRP